MLSSPGFCIRRSGVSVEEQGSNNQPCMPGTGRRPTLRSAWYPWLLIDKIIHSDSLIRRLANKTGGNKLPPHICNHAAMINLQHQ